MTDRTDDTLHLHRPVEAELFEVALLDFKELGFDFNLLHFVVVTQDNAHALKVTAALSDDELLTVKRETRAW